MIDIKELLKNFEIIGESMVNIENAVKELKTQITAIYNEKTGKTEAKEPKKAITLEEVRTVLSGLSRDGHTKEVKELLIRHGADRLSAVKPEEYESLLADAREIR